MVIFLLLAPTVLIPILVYWALKVPRSKGHNTRADVARYFLLFLAIVLGSRTLVGLLLISGEFNLWAVGKFFPIRIAGANFGIVAGLPYIFACLAILWFLPHIVRSIAASRRPEFAVWALAVCTLLSFGGIQGGLVEGVTGVGASQTHRHDAALADNYAETFALHNRRAAGLIAPAYEASHTVTHPPGSLVYWNLVGSLASPFWFSIINLFVYSLAFPVIHWSLRRCSLGEIAPHVTIACMLVPGLLVYGVGSDDSLIYALWASIIGLTSVAIRHGRLAITAAAAGILVVALNLSYSAAIMLPAMYSFTTNEPIARLFNYLRLIRPHVLVALSVVFVGLLTEFAFTGFSVVDGMRTVFAIQKPYTFFTLITHGQVVRGIVDRIMVILDFLIFAGPVIIFLLTRLLARPCRRLASFEIRNVALAVLFGYLVLNTPGAGETARGWGGLYVLLAFCWLPDLLRRETEETRIWLMRSQFVWALLLQAPLNFVW